MGSGITSGECQAQDAMNISEEEVHLQLFTSANAVLMAIIVPIVFCLGVTTNCTFLFVLFRVPKIRSETYIYLMHLALADLLFLSLAATYDIWRYRASPVAQNVPFASSTGCASFFFFINLTYYTSIALVTLVSFERFFAICHPMKHLKIRGKRRTYRLVAICWLVGLVSSGILLPRHAILEVACLQWPDSDKYQGFPSAMAYCGAVQPWVKYYTKPLLDIPWLIAMVANLNLYVRILQTLNKRSGASNNGKRDQKAQQTRNQVAKMLIVNGVVFFICQIPLRIISLSGWICSLAQIPNLIPAALGNTGETVFIILVYLNSVVNPLIYGAVNSQYRAAFIQAFYCKARYKKGPVKPPFTLRAPQNRNATAETPTNNNSNETRL